MFWEKFLRKLINGRAAIILLVIAIFVGGCVSYYVIPKQENPNTSIAAAYVTTVYPGASPEEVDSFVTQPIEEEILKLEHIDYVQSTSLNSASVSIVMYDYDVTIDDVLTDLKDAVDSVQPDLPDMCFESEVTAVMVDKTQFIISLSGDNYAIEDLVEYGETIRSTLLEVDGVSAISIEGERTKQVNVEVDVDRMEIYGVSIENVLGLMQAQNINIPSGSIEYDTGAITVNTPAVFETLQDIENTVVGGSTTSVAFVKLKDVADVSIGYADAFSFRQDGKPAVMIVGYFEDGTNAVNIGKRVRTEIESLKTQLPPDLIFHEVMYSPEDVDRSITDFIINLVESVALIVLVVMIGVQLRNGIIISISIPLSIFITFIVMWLFKIEFQFISIAALIISLGILVDNAIVISEAIQQHLNMGEDRVESIVAAVQETWKPILTSTLTTVATFAIAFFLPGAIGLVAATIPIVVIASLFASYFVAMVITPVLAYIFFKPESEEAQQKPSALRDMFIRLLQYGLENRKKVIAISFILLAVGLILMSQVGIKFFPTANKPVVYINIDAETVSLKDTDAVVRDVEALLADSALVDHYSAAIGTDMPTFFMTVPARADADNAAQIMVELNADAIKEFATMEDVARALQSNIDENIAGATVTVRNLEYSVPTDAPITLYVLGDDQSAINTAAANIAEALRTIPGTDNVRDTASDPVYEYVVDLDSEILSTYGVLKYDIVKQINTALMGATSAAYVSGGEEMDIVVSANIKTLDDLKNLTISSSVSNMKVKLGQVSDINLRAVSPTINRYNGDLYVTVLSGVRSGYSAISIENKLNSHYLREAELDGITVQSKGEFKNMMDLLGALPVPVAIALFAIYVIIYFQFNSFKKPLVIISSIPLSLIGCCFGLWIFRMDLQAMAILGAVSLFGIVVNNGIVLVEYMEMARAQGKTMNEACEQAVRMRYRPIMMTSITTCIGLVPLILSGDAMTAPMASVLLFGMLFSTFLTMAVTPVLYAVAEERGTKKKHFKASDIPSQEEEPLI